MLMSRVTKIAVLLGMAVSGLAIAQPASWAASHKPVVAQPDEKVAYTGTLSLLTKFGQQQLSPYFVTLAAAYEKMHPGVHVTLDQQTDDSVKDKTKTLVASNSLPDIYFSWTGNWGENFVRGNRAVDLGKVVGPETPWGKTLTPAAVAAFVWNGKNYGVPLYLDAKFMGYNKTVFTKLGISVPKSFDELLTACDTIRKSGMVPISLGNKEAWPAIHYIGQLLAYTVPQAVLEKDFNPKTATYTDPGYVTALDDFKALETRCTDGGGMNGVSYETAIQSFSNVKSAMYYQEILEFDGSANPQTPLKQAEFGFFVLPAAGRCQGHAQCHRGRAGRLYDQHPLQACRAGAGLHEVRDDEGEWRGAVGTALWPAEFGGGCGDAAELQRLGGGRHGRSERDALPDALARYRQYAAGGGGVA